MNIIDDKFRKLEHKLDKLTKDYTSGVPIELLDM